MTTLARPAPVPSGPSPASAARTIADLLHRLGDIPPERVLLDPPPGRATVEDVVRALDHDNRLYELIDGTLVEMAAGIRGSLLAIAIASILRDFILPRNLGFVCGADGTMQIRAALIRLPDVAFVSWARVGGRIPDEPVPHLAPDLAVEVLSVSNTAGEMARKRREYFQAGVRLVWQIDARARTAAVYTSAEQPAVVLREDQALDSGDVLPGFALPLHDLFAELDRQMAGGATA